MKTTWKTYWLFSTVLWERCPSESKATSCQRSLQPDLVRNSMSRTTDVIPYSSSWRNLWSQTMRLRSFTSVSRRWTSSSSGTDSSTEITLKWLNSRTIRSSSRCLSLFHQRLLRQLSNCLLSLRPCRLLTQSIIFSSSINQEYRIISRHINKLKITTTNRWTDKTL